MTESLIFAGVLSFIIFSILFINRKTKDLAQLKQHKVLALDQPENNIIIRLNPFSIILCIFNILIGIILVGASAYILIAFPISFFYLDEIARLLVLLWALGFGALMIWYQVKVLLFHFKPEKIN